MQTMKFITKKNHEDKYICWCTTNTLKGFRDFMQYILDNTNNPESFMLWDTKYGLIYDAYKVATKQYKMRKRSLEERLQGIQTGKWENVVLD